MLTKRNPFHIILENKSIYIDFKQKFIIDVKVIHDL